MEKETADLLKPLLDKHPPEVIIALVAEFLGWDIAIPGDPNAPCEGIILGNSGFIQVIVESLNFIYQNADKINIDVMSVDDDKKILH